MKNKIKILFFGTPEFSAIVLEKMIAAGYKPMAVVTAPDKPVGRKQVLTPSAVKNRIMKYETGIRNKIQVLQPEKISDLKPVILNLKPSLIVLAAFGQLIPREILELPKYGCLNIHPSLLPKYRGASPIQTAILNGDAETGVTIMLMDEKLDHGDMVASSRFKISDLRYNCQELTEELANLGADLLIETIPKWVNGKIKAKPQDDKKATLTKIIKKEDGKIDWHKSAEEIKRMVRAFNPWPGAFTRIMNNELGIRTKMLKILKAQVLKNENKKEPGTVFLTADKQLAASCKENALVLVEVQLEGKKATNGRDFINGYQAILGSILS